MDKFDRIFQLHTILSSRRTAIPLQDLMARLECSKSVEDVADEQSFVFLGAKKYTDDEDLFNGSLIGDVSQNEAIEHGSYQLIARHCLAVLQFLFVDEAGQVSLANVIAMGTSAKSIVLLGDQMQLGEPIQGLHPSSSGESSLEYLLQGQATISPNRGIFLGTTWRMHPHVCRFISDAVYDGRLAARGTQCEQSAGTRRECPFGS
jgi:hypothetical protein